MKTHLIALTFALLAIVTRAAGAQAAAQPPIDDALLTLYRESITALFNSTGPGEKYYAVGDDLLPLLKKSCPPAVVARLKSRSERKAMTQAERDRRLVYDVAIVYVERVGDRVKAKASFHVGPENSLTYSVEVQRDGAGWKLVLFELFSIS